MSGQFFNRLFGYTSKTFATVPEVDEFVQKEGGKLLEIRYVHLDVCSSRGSVFSVKSAGNADKRFDDALVI